MFLSRTNSEELDQLLLFLSCKTGEPKIMRHDQIAGCIVRFHSVHTTTEVMKWTKTNRKSWTGINLTNYLTASLKRWRQKTRTRSTIPFAKAWDRIQNEDQVKHPRNRVLFLYQKRNEWWMVISCLFSWLYDVSQMAKVFFPILEVRPLFYCMKIPYTNTEKTWF